MTEQNTAKKRKVSAWAVSIIVHAAVLMILAFVQFSKGFSQPAALPTPKASITQVDKVINKELVVPKPKVKNASSINRPKRKNLFASTNEISRNEATNVIAVSDKQDLETLFGNSSSNINNAIDFFGNKTYQRKICYVVDCSGSMLGLFRDVRINLTDSISSLRPDNFFNVIIFRGGQTIELSSDTLLRATTLNINKASDMIAKAPRPLGSPDAYGAIRKALSLKDPSGYKPDVIYFLTDGFDFSAESNADFAVEVEEMRQQLSPTTRIHTVGFWTNRADAEMLKQIALKSQGKFVEYK